MKTVLKVIVILIVSFIVAAALFIGMRMYQGHKNIELVDKYLAEHNLTDKIIFKWFHSQKNIKDNYLYLLQYVHQYIDTLKFDGEYSYAW